MLIVGKYFLVGSLGKRIRATKSLLGLLELEYKMLMNNYRQSVAHEVPAIDDTSQPEKFRSMYVQSVQNGCCHVLLLSGGVCRLHALCPTLLPWLYFGCFPCPFLIEGCSLLSVWPSCPCCSQECCMLYALFSLTLSSPG